MTREMASRAPFTPVAPASPLGALPDDALVALVSEGSEAAFETLDRRHRPAVYRHCAGILRSPHDADEAAQRTMIRAYRAMAGGRGPASVAPWLLAIARNESYDLLRARKGTEALTLEIEAGGESPVEHIERRERMEALKDDLADLPETQRRALLLRGVGDLSHAEIARLMGGTPGEMRTLVHEARVSLAEFEAGSRSSSSISWKLPGWQ
jgi:RNA polymerase sigma-70 factor (ECF subfamily)